VSKVHYGVRYWLDRYPASRRPSYPQHRGELKTEVAIVGGGAIGCVVAYVFAAAGIKVALFESGRLAQGGSAGSTGIVVHEPEADLHALIKQHGLRDGRHLYQTARRGSLEYLSAIRRLHIDCAVQTADVVHAGVGPKALRALRRNVRLGAMRVWRSRRSAGPRCRERQV